MGPIVEGGELAKGAKVPGTQFRLDPVQAAFNIGTSIRWVVVLAPFLYWNVN